MPPGRPTAASLAERRSSWFSKLSVRNPRAAKPAVQGARRALLEKSKEPITDENGEYIVDNVDGQDMMAWISQGTITDRTAENLGSTDQGVAAFRRMLRREIKKVEAGEDPMCTFRDPEQNERIDLPNEKKKHHNSDGMKSWLMRTHMRFSPILDDLVELYEPSSPAPVKSKAG